MTWGGSSASRERSRSRSSIGLSAALKHRAVLWILYLIGISCAALVYGFASGCARTVLVPESSPVRIGPKVDARVYALVDGEWVLSENRVTIPEGWYCVPPSYVEEP